jgi:hypothetical protein
LIIGAFGGIFLGGAFLVDTGFIGGKVIGDFGAVAIIYLLI